MKFYGTFLIRLDVHFNHVFNQLFLWPLVCTVAFDVDETCLNLTALLIEFLNYCHVDLVPRSLPDSKTFNQQRGKYIKCDFYGRLWAFVGHKPINIILKLMTHSFGFSFYISKW